MSLSPPLLSIGGTVAHLALLGKVFVPIAVLTISVIGSGKKLLAVFTRLGGLTRLGLFRLNFFISFCTSSTLTLFRIKQVGQFKLSFIFIILGCISYLLIIESIAYESSTSVS